MAIRAPDGANNINNNKIDLQLGNTIALKRRRRQFQRLLFRSSEGIKISYCTLHKDDQVDNLN